MRASKTPELKGPEPWPHIRSLTHLCYTTSAIFSEKNVWLTPLPVLDLLHIGSFKICFCLCPRDPTPSSKLWIWGYIQEWPLGLILMVTLDMNWINYHGNEFISTLPPHRITPTFFILGSSFFICSDITAATPAPELASITNWNKSQIVICQRVDKLVTKRDPPEQNFRLVFLGPLSLVDR